MERQSCNPRELQYTEAERPGNNPDSHLTPHNSSVTCTGARTRYSCFYFEASPHYRDNIIQTQYKLHQQYSSVFQNVWVDNCRLI